MPELRHHCGGVPKAMSVKVSTTSEHKLCIRCMYGHTMTFNNGAERSYCTMFHPPKLMTLPVERCSEFLDNNATSKHDMEKIAWVVKTDKHGETIGFKPPEKEKD